MTPTHVGVLTRYPFIGCHDGIAMLESGQIVALPAENYHRTKETGAEADLSPVAVIPDFDGFPPPPLRVRLRAADLGGQMCAEAWGLLPAVNWSKIFVNPLWGRRFGGGTVAYSEEASGNTFAIGALHQIEIVEARNRPGHILTVSFTGPPYLPVVRSLYPPTVTSQFGMALEGAVRAATQTAGSFGLWTCDHGKIMRINFAERIGAKLG